MDNQIATTDDILKTLESVFNHYEVNELPPSSRGDLVLTTCGEPQGLLKGKKEFVIRVRQIDASLLTETQERIEKPLSPEKVTCGTGLS